MTTKPRYKVMTKEEAKKQGKLAMAAIAIGKAKAKAAKERSESKAKANAAKKEIAEATKLQWARCQEAKTGWCISSSMGLPRRPQR